MFGFLNNAMLLALGAAVIPLLIHLFSRRKLKVVPFSSLTHLIAMRRQQVRRIKIRQLLLLLLRTLALLAAALAFARPITRTGYMGGRSGVSATIIFDNSASMTRDTHDGVVYDLAMGQTKGLLETFGEGDEVVLIPTVANGESHALGSPGAARASLDALAPTDSRGDLDGAMGAAVAVLSRATHVNREIFIVSDFQNNEFADTITRLDTDAAGVTAVYAVQAAEATAINAGIAQLDFGGQLVTPGSPMAINVTIRNYDDNPLQGEILSLFIDDRRVDQRDLQVAAGGLAKVSFTHIFPSAGAHIGRVELSPDEYLGDNTHEFAVTIPDIFNALVVDNHGGGEFVRLALAPTEEGARRWRVKQIALSSLGAVTLEDYQIVTLVGVGKLDPADVARLSRFVRRGGGLLYIPGPDIDPSQLAGGLGDLLGVRMPAKMTVNPPDAGHFTLTGLSYTHPALAPFAQVYTEGLPELRFFSLPKFVAEHDAVVLGRFSGDHPAVIEKTLEKGAIITFAAVLTPDFSDVQSHSFFVPFVIRLCEYLGSDVSRYETGRRVGERGVVRLPSGVSASNIISLLAPDSSRQFLEITFAAGEPVVTIPMFHHAGVHRLVGPGGTLETFAVNRDPAEGDFADADGPVLSAKLGVDIIETDPQIAWAGFLAEKRQGAEWWRLFLWVAVVALILESLLASRRSAEPEEAWVARNT